MSIKIYKCNTCGEILLEIKGNSNTIKCCGANMHSLIGKEVEEMKEKHVPIISEVHCGVKVKVSDEDHPMNFEHYIEWIMIETNMGIRINYLKPFDKPETKFALAKGEEVKRAYAYCNIHGLWVCCDK